MAWIARVFLRNSAPFLQSGCSLYPSLPTKQPSLSPSAPSMRLRRRKHCPFPHELKGERGSERDCPICALPLPGSRMFTLGKVMPEDVAAVARLLAPAEIPTPVSRPCSDASLTRALSKC
jgi:hypothetical protein